MSLKIRYILITLTTYRLTYETKRASITGSIAETHSLHAFRFRYRFDLRVVAEKIFSDSVFAVIEIPAKGFCSTSITVPSIQTFFLSLFIGGSGGLDSVCEHLILNGHHNFVVNYILDFIYHHSH